MIMMKVITLIVFLFCSYQGIHAQDSTVLGTVTVYKDPRIDLLNKLQVKTNYTKYYGPHAAKGYRLMVISTNDRDLAMRVRSQLLQRFPDQKVYMTFQVPNIRLKFGNFTDKKDAERYQKLITSGKIVTNNVYIVPEVVEVKSNKSKDKNDE